MLCLSILKSLLRFVYKKYIVCYKMEVEGM